METSTAAVATELEATPVLTTKRVKGEQVGRDVVAKLVRETLGLSSDREANNVVNVVTSSIVTVIRENIEKNGFTLKLPGFGKFAVRHKTGKMRKIPLTGETKRTADKRKVKFTALSDIRELERKPKA
jgi:nucleoid DNA-binding protein